jgi:hypothetical protein
VRRRDPRFREPTFQQQRAQQPRIGAVGLGALLRAPRRGDLGRIPQMHTHTRGRQLFTHVPPPSPALQREIRISACALLGQPAPQRRPRCRADLTPPHQTVIVYVIERDLLSMHVETAYHRHWDLLKLPQNF